MKIISEKQYGNVKVVKNSDWKWAVTDLEGNEIVPFGKYDWIYGFDHGLARVRIGKRKSEPVIINGHIDIFSLGKVYGKGAPISKDTGEKYGIINEKGVEVVPVEYDDIWNFIGKEWKWVTADKDGERTSIDFCLLDGWHDIGDNNNECDYNERDYDYDYQDRMRDIVDSYDDAFDGDPEAYWNID
jgi:hypothetical protein